MSISSYDSTTGELTTYAGSPNVDQVLSASSKNPIANKTVYNALAEKIEKTVNDLVNYYTMSQVYNKAEVRELIGAINTLTLEVVGSLPTSDISDTTIYLVGPTSGNYDEYIHVGNTWVKIGDTQIDLSNYVTTTQLSAAISDFLTSTQINLLLVDKQDKNLSASVTVGAETINTVEDAIDELAGIVPSNAASSNKLATAADISRKQDTLTFDNTPTDASTNPVTSDGIYEADKIIQDQVNDIVNIYGAKNLLPNNGADTYTVNNVTYTKNSNGSVTVQTSAAASAYTLYNIFPTATTVQNKNGLIISATGITGIAVRVKDTDNVWYGRSDREETIPAGKNIIACSVAVNSGATFSSPVTIYPMLRPTSITDSTYEPYAMTNRELTEHHTTVAKTFTQSSTDVATYLRNANTSSYIAFGYSYNRTMITVNAIFTIKASGNALYKSDGTTVTSGNENWELIKISNFPYSKAIPDGPLSGLLFLNRTDLKDLYCSKRGNDLIFAISATDYADFVGKGVRLSATIMLK